MPKPVAIRKSKQATRADIVDELGSLQQEIEPKLARQKELIEQIRAWAEAELSPEAAACYEGWKYVAPVSAKPDKRSIPLTSRLKILGLLGDQKFCELAGITLEKAERHLSAVQFSELVEVQKYAGTRSVSTMPRLARKAA